MHGLCFLNADILLCYILLLSYNLISLYLPFKYFSFISWCCDAGVLKQDDILQGTITNIDCKIAMVNYNEIDDDLFICTTDYYAVKFELWAPWKW